MIDLDKVRAAEIAFGMGDSDGHDVLMLIGPMSDAIRTLWAALDEANTRLEDLQHETFPATWAGFREFLRAHYPEDVFPGDFTVRAARALAEANTENQRLRNELDRHQDRVSDQAMGARKERDLALAAVQRVEALCDELARSTGGWDADIATRFRAALAPQDNGDSE